MKNFNHSKFLADLEMVPWDSAYLYDNADDVLNHWSTLYTEILDQHAPIKKKWVRSDQLPWITPQIQREILLRNRLFKRHKKNPSSSIWEAHKIQRNKVTSLKRNCITEFCSTACSATKNHGEFWKKLKLLLPATVPNQQEKIILVENDKVISDPKLVAKMFNDYFANTVDTVMNQLLIIPLTPA
jgi:hypothetical protein